MRATFATENWNYAMEPILSLSEKGLQGSKIHSIILRPAFTVNTTTPWDLLDISINLDPEISSKIAQDNDFKNTLINVIRKIKNYFHEKNMSYEIKVFIWRDAEIEDWTENMIKVKTTYQDPEDRMKIWWDIQNLLDNEEKEIITVLLED